MKKMLGNKKVLIGLCAVLLAVAVALVVWFATRDGHDGSYYFDKARTYVWDGDINGAKKALDKVEKSNLLDEKPELRPSFISYYNYVTNNKGKPIQVAGRYTDNWIGKDAKLVVEGNDAANYKLPYIEIKGQAFAKASYPIKLKFTFNDKSIYETSINSAGNFDICMPVEDVSNIKSGKEVKVSLDKTFCPQTLSINEDKRNLGVNISDVGFNDYAVKGNEYLEVNGLSKDKWMYKSLSLKIVDLNKKVRGIKLTGVIPKYLKLPMNVTVSQKGEVIQTFKIEKAGTAVLNIDLSSLKSKSKVTELDITADKVFIPQQVGINKDTRELSIKFNKIELVR